MTDETMKASDLNGGNGSGNGPENGGGERLWLTLALIGALGALALSLIVEFEKQMTMPLKGGLATGLIVLTVALLLGWKAQRIGARIGLAFLLALFLGALNAHHFHVVGDGADSGRFYSVFWMIFSVPVIAFVLLSFGLTAISGTDRTGNAYGRFFPTAGGVPLQLFIANIIGWLLFLFIRLWSGLFEMLGIPIFAIWLNEVYVAMPIYGLAFGLGVGLARQWNRAGEIVRWLGYQVCRFTAPLAAFFTLTFLIAVPVNGVETIWQSGSAAWLMLALSLCSLLILNGVLQDGTRPHPALWLRISIIILAIGLPVYVALANWALWIRVDQYGFTPPRAAGVQLAFLLLVHVSLLAVLNLVSLVRRSAWPAGLGVLNMASLGVLVVVLLLQKTPLLGPETWTIRDQVARLMDGRTKAKDFDYRYLKFRLGEAGEEAFEDLKSVEDHPELDAIREGIADADAAESYYYPYRPRTVPGPNAAPPPQAEEPETPEPEEPDTPQTDDTGTPDGEDPNF